MLFRSLGYAMQPDELDAVYQRFTALADRKKRIYDQDLIALLQNGSAASDRVAEGANNWARASSAA